MTKKSFRLMCYCYWSTHSHTHYSKWTNGIELVRLLLHRSSSFSDSVFLRWHYNFSCESIPSLGKTYRQTGFSLMCLFCFVSGGLYTCVLLVFKSVYLIWPTFVLCSYYGICVACMQRVKHANYYSLDVRVHCGVSNRCSVLSLSVISTSY